MQNILTFLCSLKVIENTYSLQMIKKMVSNTLIKFLLIFCILILFHIGIYNDILHISSTISLSWKYASKLVNYTGESAHKGTYINDVRFQGGVGGSSKIGQNRTRGARQLSKNRTSHILVFLLFFSHFFTKIYFSEMNLPQCVLSVALSFTHKILKTNLDFLQI